MSPLTSILISFAGMMVVPTGVVLVHRHRARVREDRSRFVRARDMGLDPEQLRPGTKLIVFSGPGEGEFRFVLAVNGEIVEFDSPWETVPTHASQIIVVEPQERWGR